MGQVWKARHRGGAEVAIKFLLAARMREDWAVEFFENEIRASAGLNHPFIVPVLDHGLVETPGPPPLTPGAPFLVMELVRGRSLHDFKGRLSWPRLRDTLLQLLDALAHSHARGVIHRDLKPGNVLLVQDGTAHPNPALPMQAQLTDFGLAQALESAASDLVAGTPAYMAPEQLEGRWRDQGAWTDLYSLGCMAWTLASGVPPFGRNRPMPEYLQAHKSEEPPKLAAKRSVPPGFEDWLRRLLAKRPDQRFLRAADAALELVSLPGVVDDDEFGGILDAPVASTMTLAARTQTQAAPLTVGTQDLKPLSTLQPQDMQTLTEVVSGRAATGPLQRLHAAPRLPWPQAWQRPEPPSRSSKLAGVGLGVFELRKLPLVAREAERDLLWETMRRVYELRRQELIVLSGPAGCGKSRLGSWICERAEELGVAISLQTEVGEDGDGTVALSRMVTRHLRCEGLDRKGLQTRLAGLGDLSDPLVELMQPASDDTERLARFQSPREKQAVIMRLLAWLTQDSPTGEARPLVLFVEDAHRGSDALQFLRRAVQDRDSGPLPVLFVASVRDEAVVDDVETRDEFSRVLLDEATTQLEVGPLDPESHRLLVGELLGMEGDLVEQVARRTEGNPLFAEQLVGDWVDRGLLEVGRDGFRLRQGAKVTLPADLHQVWREKVERVLGIFHGDEAQALEIAAVLGMRLERDLWHRVCKVCGVRPSPLLVGRLLDERLLRATEDGYVFSHAMFREALVLRSRDRRRVHRHHRACASVLAGLGERSERLGRHLLLAGRIDEALDVLLDAAEAALTEGDAARSGRLLEYRERALRVVDPPQSDPRLADGWVLRSEQLYMAGRYDESKECIARLIEAAERYGWDGRRSHALHLQARHHLREGEVGRSQAVLELALGCATDDRQRAKCKRGLGQAHCIQGRAHRGRFMLRQALELLANEDDPVGVAQCNLQLARAWLQDGDFDTAAEHARIALENYEASGARWFVGDCYNILGEIARLTGDLEEAERLYRRSLEEVTAVGKPTTAIARANIGFVQLERERYVEAKKTFVGILGEIRRGLSPLLGSHLHVALTVCAAMERDWAAWDRHYREARDVIGRTSYVDIDNARMAELSGELTLGAGKLERASRIYGLAREQYLGLGRQSDADGIADVISRLPS